MGRICSNYYVDIESMNKFLVDIWQDMSEEDFIYLMAQSKEFAQLKGRPEEEEEMKNLHWYCSLKVDKDEIMESYGKAMILIDAYLKGKEVKAFSLIADTGYIV